MTPLWRVVAWVPLLALNVLTPPASAFDSNLTFAKGTRIISAEGSYGEQFNLQGFDDWSKIKYWNFGVRASILPFNPLGPSVLHGAFEVGLEPLFQKYTEPRPAFWSGLVAVFRYHFLSLGPFVPYAEGGAGAGGTDLRVREIDSNFSFLLWAGLGASVFLTDSIAVYAGYRYEHNSNGNTDKPNRGWESHVGLVGVSYYFR
jgi:opacity protein-like surface antigen